MGSADKQHVQGGKEQSGGDEEEEEGTLMNDATLWSESVQIAESLKKAKHNTDFLMKNHFYS